MAGSTYMTVAGLLYAFIASVLLCRVFFNVVSNVNDYAGAFQPERDAKTARRVTEQILDAGIALPMLAIAFAALAFGLLTKGGLNGAGVIMMVGLAAALAYYAGVKDTLLDSIAEKKPPVRELPPPQAMLPQPESAVASRPVIVRSDDPATAADTVTPISMAKPVSQPRKTG